MRAFKENIDESKRVIALIFFNGTQQAATQGIAIKMWIAPPDDARIFIDQGAGVRIADHAKVKVAHDCPV